MACAWRVMTARMVASLAFGVVGSGVRVAVLEGISWMRVRGSRGTLKASERMCWSVRWEKVVSRRRVRICEKEGDSIRSAVSSRRRLREGEIGAGWTAVGEAGGEGIVEVGIEGEEVGLGATGSVELPNSWRTKSSWPGRGRR